MNRADLIAFESTVERTRRQWQEPFELRASQDDEHALTFDGYAYVTDHEYEVYGGAPFGWVEKMASGASKRTLRNKADVAFLVNHDGLTLARTKSKTMSLADEDKGLHVLASLDGRMHAVQDLRIASERGDVDEMSFAFRVRKDEWFDDDGNKSTAMEGTRRTILEVDLNKGDVSAVNYGANDGTSGGFRDVDVALAEMRAGRALNAEQRELVRSLAHALDEDESGETDHDHDPFWVEVSRRASRRSA